ncbi:MAG: EamA family transporter RarD [Campylobacteraceae bacterium]|nr:EamA family transporter RarD [Campylobacteraceae bacterium]
MKEEKLGYIFAVFAFLFWGAVSPIYFKEVGGVTALEVLMHRVVWSFLILIPLVYLTKQTEVLKLLLKNKNKLKYLLYSTFFVSINWLIFIWAVANERIMEASLGYYINPLINIALGFIFFGERMTRNQNIAIVIAFLAVLYQIIALGTLPLVSLSLAVSFAFYGMIRKKVDVGSIVGLFVETLMLMPLAIIYILYLINTNSMAFLNESDYITFMLTLGGLATIIPLLLFNGAATRMKLSTLGFFQYIGPTCAFLLAVFVYNEEFNFDKLITFALIWLALIIFSLDAIIKKIKA